MTEVKEMTVSQEIIALLEQAVGRRCAGGSVARAL